MSRIVCFIGSKGGSGKTFSALNTAMCLKHEMEENVLYVDANSPISNQCGEVLHELVHENFMDKHFDSESEVDRIECQTIHNVDFISCYSGKIFDQAALTSGINQNDVSASILKLSMKYDYVLVDIGTALQPLHDLFLDLSTDIVIVAQADASGVTRLVNDWESLRLRNYSSSQFRLLVNKWEGDSAITKDWLSARLGIEANAFVPNVKDNDLLFPFYTNKSKVLKKSPITNAFIKFIATLTTATIEHKNIHDVVESVDKKRLENAISKKDEKIKSLKILLQEEILKIMDLKHLEIGGQLDKQAMQELEEKVEFHAVNILDKKTDITDRYERNDIISSVIDGVLYLGPLMPLLADEDVSEIMVNDANTIYVEKKGKLILSRVQFLSDQQQMRIIDRIVAPIGRRVDVSSPMVDARLLDGSRVNVIIPPLAPRGSIITIRKFEKDPLTVNDLVKFGTINQQIITFLEAVVLSRLNIVVSGGTGSGKTTLLNILSSYIPDDERVITVEDSAELQLKQRHVLTLEARPPNIENKGEVTIRDLVKNALRMRPERIVVGECRAGEALDMLQAMNTGHDGSMTTIHANSSKEMLSRIETLVMYAGTQLPSIAIRQQINSAVDIVFQIARLKDGSRKITQVSEVTGISGEEIHTEDIFTYKQTGVDMHGKIRGSFVATGYIPKCMDRFEANGIEVPREIFWSS